MPYKPRLIISGGQTGADLAGLIAAERLSIATGGNAPRGFRTELGSKPILGERFGLVETASDQYPPRTRLNVQESDATVIFNRAVSSPGSRLTINYCRAENKPFISNPQTPQHLRDFCERNNVQVLNVAGNRESSSPGITKFVIEFLITAFSGE